MSIGSTDCGGLEVAACNVHIMLISAPSFFYQTLILSPFDHSASQINSGFIKEQV